MNPEHNIRGFEYVTQLNRFTGLLQLVLRTRAVYAAINSIVDFL